MDLAFCAARGRELESQPFNVRRWNVERYGDGDPLRTWKRTPWTNPNFVIQSGFVE